MKPVTVREVFGLCLLKPEIIPLIALACGEGGVYDRLYNILQSLYDSGGPKNVDIITISGAAKKAGDSFEDAAPHGLGELLTECVAVAPLGDRARLVLGELVARGLEGPPDPHEFLTYPSIRISDCAPADVKSGVEAVLSKVEEVFEEDETEGEDQ